MEKITGNEPVTPCEVEGPVNDDILQTYSLVKCYGLTIRQHFAAMAMQGLLANSWYPEMFKNRQPDDLTKVIVGMSVEFADALISELNKNQ